jgi:hypothetical protein
LKVATFNPRLEVVTSACRSQPVVSLILTAAPNKLAARRRRAGSRNKGHNVAEQLLKEHSEAITRKWLLAALQGDSACIRQCMEHLLLRRRQAAAKLKPSEANVDAQERMDLSGLTDDELQFLENLAGKVKAKSK